MPVSRTPFPENRHTLNQVQKSFAELLQKHQDAVQARVLSPQNILRYSHGRVWTHPANPDSSEGSMSEHRAEIQIPSRRVADGDLTLIPETLGEISSQMESTFMTSMYSMMHETCEKTGNTFSASESGLAEAFARMLDSIPFSVGADGEVNLPQIHTGDATELLNALKSQPPEFHERIEEIKRRKTEEALQVEADRKAKFKRASE